MSERIYNFSAGPATLPESVLKKAQEALWSLSGTGIGILEHSHRGEAFKTVIEEAESNCRKLAGVGDDYEILFLQGGASTQFFQIPMNFLDGDSSAEYVNTGTWSKKAIKEAKLFGAVKTLASSEDENFSYIPDQDTVQWSSGAAYAHYTSNNTIAGTQFSYTPNAPEAVPLICDASSDIFSRPIDIQAHDMIYAGAQKNLGPSGLALVIVSKALVDKGKDDLPSMMQYRTHAKAKSSFNTPPTFGIFMMGEVFKWILSEGGLEAIAEKNAHKAQLLYTYLDESKVFRGTARKDSRSDMNVCFRARNEEEEASFIAQALSKGFSGLKGHRSVGGMRASIYNAFPLEGVEKLVTFMKEFERAAS